MSALETMLAEMALKGLDPTERASIPTERVRQFLAAVRGNAQMGDLDGVLRAVEKLLAECSAAEAKVAKVGTTETKEGGHGA